MANSEYHERVKGEKRTELMRAGTDLFLEQGYDRTSLAQIAARAEISTATLFKRFPTKAALFAAIVEEYWQLDLEYAAPPAAGDPRRGLTKIGNDYACLLTRPRMADLLRVVIAELPRFPELSQTQFNFDEGAFFTGLKDYLRGEAALGTLVMTDVEEPARQFLGIISARILWPRLLLAAYDPDAVGDDKTVTEAVELILARHGTSRRTPTRKTSRAHAVR